MLVYFGDFLYDSLLEAQEDFGTIEEVDSDGNLGVKMDLPALTRLDTVHKGIEEFYRKRNNGWEKSWEKAKNGNIGGYMRLTETKYLFAEDNGIYGEGDEEDLKYFRPLDYPSPETYVGFIIKPDIIYKSLYYMSVSNYELNNLDLDYNGYTQMAFEARIFNHWQLVLLYYMDGTGIGSVETETFKTEMPKIFPGWTWENFIAKFESFRLSNKK
ncbi:hypothetical protein [Taibaiella koreensis]|uniref:hypothetical protein n=1 Tax=Taibaiella koreensis TaxID=1268548 RepID=UPI000E59C4AB|nr:hypothetical protein [Taibaiella koreensis]